MANPFEKWLSYEDREHIKVVKWIKGNLPNVISFHVPNEGKKSPFERYKASIMGLLKGCPDFIILYPKHSEIKRDESGRHYKELLYNGLMIELKAQEHERVVQKGAKIGKIVKSKGKLSPEQKDVLERLNQAKYKAVCCFGADEAIKEIKDYFSIK
jgi:hypothetical protein